MLSPRATELIVLLLVSGFVLELSSRCSCDVTTFLYRTSVQTMLFTLVLLLAVVAACISLLAMNSYVRYLTGDESMPGPTPHFLFGNAAEIGKFGFAHAIRLLHKPLSSLVTLLFSLLCRFEPL